MISPQIALLAACFLVFTAPASAAIFTVGDDGACDFSGIQAAISAAADGDVIRIARNQSYTSQQLAILNKSLVLRGGYADCSAASQTSPNTTVGGTGNDATLQIVNNDTGVDRFVTLSGLTIEGGGGSLGGGIRILGRVTALLASTTVRNNSAMFGGGIYVNSTLGELGFDDTRLILTGNTIISGNAAIGGGGDTSSGGGIYCGTATVELLDWNVSILTNTSFGTHADMGGGGIYLANCRLFSAAGGIGISNNLSMARGGGVHATGSSTLVFRHRPGAPTGPHVSGNGSELDGGGISLVQSAMSAQELAVFGNTASGKDSEGGGVVARENSIVFWGRSLFEGSNCPAARQSCNRLTNNATATAGGGLSLQSGSQALIRQIEISGNQGSSASAVSVTGNNTGLNLEGALITGNTSTGSDSTQNSVIRLRGSASARLSHATIADNPGHGRIIDIADTGNELFLHSSVISEASGGAIVSSFGADATTRCLMTHHSLFEFDHASNAVRPYSHRAQLFLDPNAGDYRPNPFGFGQLLVDYCDGTFTTLTTDGLLTERGVDVPEITNRPGQFGGPYDIGAYELGELPDHTIFSDRFEAIPVTFPGDAPCHTTLQACIDGVPDGSVIEIAAASPIAENLTIEKSLTLRRAPGFKNLLQGSIFMRSTDLPSRIVISDLNIQGRLRASPGLADLEVVIADNRVTHNASLGSAIEVSSGTFPPYGNVQAHVLRNTVSMTGSGSNNQCSGIRVGSINGDGSSSARIQGNRVTVTDCQQGRGIIALPGGHSLSTDVIGNIVTVPGTNNGILLTGQGSSAGSPHVARVINNVVTGQVNVAGAVGALVVTASGSGEAIEAQIINNTVADNQTGLRVSARTDLGAAVSGMVANNVVAFQSGGGLSIDSDLTEVSNRKNLVFGNNSDSFTPGTGTVTADPLFVSAGDYRLAAGSPAVNAGANAQVPADITTDAGGLPRIVSGIVDIGAFERQ